MLVMDTGEVFAIVHAGRDVLYVDPGLPETVDAVSMDDRALEYGHPCARRAEPGRYEIVQPD
jgi:hypothetical protein